MTCSRCGSIPDSGSATCPQCGTPAISANPPASPQSPSPEIAEARRLSLSAWKVIKAVVINPNEDLPNVFRKLPLKDALETGLFLATLFDLCVILGIYLLLPHWAGRPGLGVILKLLLLGFVPPAAIAGASLLARKVFQTAAGAIETDVLIAGATLIPTGFVLLAAGVLGMANFEVVAIVSVFALVYTVLILHTTCARISGIPEARAVPAVPIILLIAAWLSKIAFSAFL